MDSRLSKVEMHQPPTYNSPWRNFFHHPCPSFKTQHSFGMFSKLPAELKSMIWSFAIDTPQLVQFVCESGPDPTQYYFRAKYTVPAVLHICRDSRAQALKSYTPFLETTLLYPLYFNYKVDYMLLEGQSTMHLFEALSRQAHIGKELDGVENVAFMVTGLNDNSCEEEELIQVGRVFGGAKRIILLEQIATWWGNHKEIWSDEHMRRIFTTIRRAKSESNPRIAEPPPEVRVIKLRELDMFLSGIEDEV
ncbi:DUF890 domain protein [Rutstroemia sp. NJR-2017a BVV2]|nr:DUF890 domain protein [Rutstroemia sp. NJR-2017a BVV2]